MVAKTILALAAVVLFAAGAAFYAARVADRRLNRVTLPPPYEVDERATRLHDGLFVADMHCDFLLWRRDLTRRYRRGHVDLPRLKKGNVSLQVFSVVTKSPWGQNYDRNAGGSDRITPLAIAQIWPVESWKSLLERAHFQAGRLNRYAQEGAVSLLRSRTDLKAFLDRRANDASRENDVRRVAALLALEGMHALEGRLSNLDTLFAVGFRMMAPVHMFDNEVAGSMHGVDKYGLTPFGRRVVLRMMDLGIIVDLAHASDATIREVLEISSGPIVVSHTGVRGTCDSPRNLSDEQLLSIAATGGVIGIGFWDRAVCGTTASDIAHAIQYTVDLVGVDHVGLGSDFDGTVLTAFDAAGMPLLTEALLTTGFSAAEIEKIMGGNVVRVLNDILPESSPE